MTIAAAGVFALPPASVGAERAATSHILVGVTPTSGFAVAVEGEEVQGSPFASDADGVLAFSLGDGYPPGPLTVTVGAPGSLIISSVDAGQIGETEALITWLTNIPATSQVEYGPTSGYGSSTPPDTVRVTSHAVLLSGLAPGTTYHYRVLSDDGQGQSAESGDRTFVTDIGPLVITGVEVSEVESDAATISWTTNRAADATVNYGTTPAYGSSTPLAPTLVTHHVVRIEGLAPATTYHFEVVSEDAYDQTARSDDGTFATEPVPLGLDGVEVVDVGFATATVRWTTNRGATSRVDYGPTPQYGTSTPVDPALVTEHSVVLNGLAFGSVYHFRVVSEGPYGEIVESDDATFETPVPTLEIGDIEVTEVGFDSAVVRWSTDRAATSLVEYGPTDGYGMEVGPDPVLVAEHSATLSGLSDGTLYHFRVSSVDTFGVEAVSADSTFTTREIQPTGPPILHDVDVVEASGAGVVLTWSTDRPATSLVRYGVGSQIDSATACDTTLVRDHAVAVAPLLPGTVYSFVAVSACGADTTVAAAVSHKTAIPPTIDLDPKSINVIKTCVLVIDASTAHVRWLTDRPCSTWVDYGPTDSYGESRPGAQIAPHGYEVRLEGLTPEAGYHYRVRAVALDGVVSSTGDRTFTMPAEVDKEPPRAPAGLHAQGRGAAVEVLWDPNEEPDLLGYHVYRLEGDRETGGAGERVERLTDGPLGDPYYLDEDVAPGVLYLYTVTAIDASRNESAPSEAAHARIDLPGPALHLAVYPNPIVDRAVFSYSIPADGEEVALRILSTSGRLVRELASGTAARGTHTVTWNGRDRVGKAVGSGVYLCELVSGEAVTRRKLTFIR